jgi:1,4-dihydroxy-2-naphthoate octaprenyltransferase
LGVAAAYGRTGSVDPVKAVVTLGGVICLHLGANLANDYFDEVTGCDRQNNSPTPISGGSRVIQEGLLSPVQIGAASGVFLILGLVQAFWLNTLVPGNLVLILGLAGMGLGLLYTAVPVKLSYRGLGELAVFLSFGPLVVAGAYLVQTGRLGAVPFLVSIPAGLMVASILLVNEVIDYDADLRAEKRTLVVILGRRPGYLAFLAVHLAAYVWIALGVFAGLYPPPALLALLPLIPALVVLRSGQALRNRKQTIRAGRAAILSHTVVTALLAISHLGGAD